MKYEAAFLALVPVIEAVIKASDAVLEQWSSGDLAAAVNQLQADTEELRERLDSLTQALGINPSGSTPEPHLPDTV